MVFSCYGCEKRYPGCHDTCEKYKAERAAHEAKKEMEQIQKGLNYYQYKQVKKNRDKRSRKWGTLDRRKK